MRNLLFFVLVIAVIMLVFSDASASLLYNITDLGTISGGQSGAYGINNSSQVVGSSNLPGGSSDSEPFLWDRTNGMQSLGPQREGFARSINNNGRVVGHFQFDDMSYGAFLWDSVNGYQKLCGGLGCGINDSSQVAINDSGHTYIWDSLNGLQDIGSLGGNWTSAGSGNCINNTGQIVGYSNLTTGSYHYHAFIWDKLSGMQDLGELGPYGSKSFGINNLGQAVGSSYDSGGSERAFIWENEVMTDIGPGEAWAINDAGQVVGNFGLWQNGVFTDLADLLVENPGWDSFYNGNLAINNNGEITGRARINGKYHAFLMTPIPEPATLLLLGLGAVMLRRKR